MNTASKIQAILKITEALIQAVNDTPNGIPAGTLYAGLMTTGCTLQQFDQLMGMIVASGRIRKQGDLYCKN